MEIMMGLSYSELLVKLAKGDEVNISEVKPVQHELVDSGIRRNKIEKDTNGNLKATELFNNNFRRMSKAIDR